MNILLKEERHMQILNIIDTNGTARVSDIMDQLHVSDMTIRRDLMELEEQGKLERVHGGAKSLHLFIPHELTHVDKQIINIEQKQMIAKKAVTLLKSGQTIFLGPGTTIEILANMMEDDSIRVVTNCLPIFETLTKHLPKMKVYLLGGEIRPTTMAFFGELTNRMLMDMHFHQAFISSNGLRNNQIMTSTVEEGSTQALALNNSVERYLLMDDSKIGQEDFYAYYHLKDLTAMITNDTQADKMVALEKFIPIF
ncbi:MAG TPA: DeoR/GlpR family DNA-binding transcription regulator [Enterococcus columbae]|nr:DeoR/GlpR family DNA-binding transcription regulator [Enterococcus columbae]